MKIVIDIQKDVYRVLKEDIYPIPDTERLALVFKTLVKKGTPLPKGHGRLGDLDALEKEIVNGIKAGNYEEGYETFAHINDMEDCVECVKYADTIIEADKDGDTD